MGTESMSEYDRAAWESCIDEIYRPNRRPLVPAGARALASKAASVVGRAVKRLPGAAKIDDTLEDVFDGAMALTFQPALRTVGPAKVVAKFAARHPQVRVLEDIRSLELSDCDRMLPPRFGYTGASAVQGGATALAVTGAEVASTVTGGTTAVVAVGAVATDVAASMAMMGRSIGVVAARYGYDVRLPDEELFALGVLSLGTASSVGGKAAAMASLSRLTQEMMRQATWGQLRKHTLVNVIEAVYKALGIRLTKQKLAQAVPVAGVAMNAGLSGAMTDRTFRRAMAIYRLRFLSEKYGIDPKEWLRDVDVSDEDIEEVVEVDEIFSTIVAGESQGADDDAVEEVGDGDGGPRGREAT